MLLGHAAGTAAALAVEAGGAVQQINVVELQHRLLTQGQVLEIVPSVRRGSEITETRLS